MKTIIVTQDDPFYSPVFFSNFLKNNTTEAVIILPTLNQKNESHLKLIMSFYGFWGFTKLGMELGLKGFLNLFNKDLFTESILKKHNIPFFHTNNINSPDTLAKIRSISPELIVAIGAPQIFKPEVLKIPPKGCINIHESPLPKYKGVFPIFWQLLHGEEQIGITIHEMDEKIDEGRNIMQKYFKHDNKSFHKLMKTAYKTAAQMLEEVLGNFDESTFKEPGPESSYFSLPDAGAIKKFKQKGLRIN
ncbi:MAG: formyltransferase family protein [Bacillota bacterium]|nr:formyltransferase family protein [Bacillota bacterium]